MDISICSAIYDKASPYIDEFLAGINDAISTYGNKGKVELLLVNDGFKDYEKLNKMRDIFPVEIINAPQSVSTAKVRNVLLNYAREYGQEAIVFTDCDDILESTALVEHIKILNKYDFSFGDQILIDQAGNLLGNSLYASWAVPKFTSGISDLINGNFIGFSGAAINKSCLNRTVCDVPDDVIATDWWFFSELLIEGKSGAMTEQPVVKYRQYHGNFHGAHPKPNLKSIKKRVRIAKQHYSNLSEIENVKMYLQYIETLEKAIVEDPDAVLALADNESINSEYWYSDVSWIGEQLLSANYNL